VNIQVHSQQDSKSEEFSKLLLDIGDGKISEMKGKIYIPNKLVNFVKDLISLLTNYSPTFINLEKIV